MDISLKFSTGKKTATEPSPVSAQVSIQKDLQKTDDSRPLAASFPRAELGDSGTRLLHGIITEEYNPQLQGIQGIRVFEEMRKSDGTVRAAMMVCTLPIRRADWYVKPASDSTQDEEIANFVRHALFDWVEDMTWDDILRQALLMTAFGVMLFEKVYGTMDHEGKTYVTLSKLAPRLPKSILQWELVDHTFGIQQIRQDGQLAQIPGSKLLIFVNEREGDNWWGTSMLRAAYQHWYRKSKYYAIDSLAFERQGLGVPTLTMPVGYTENDEKRAKTTLQNLRANEKAYMVLPPGYTFEFANMGARTTRDPTVAIEHHNKEILQSVLAQFLELGASRAGSGSRALSTDHSDLFLKAMEAIANTVRDVFNKQLVKEIVDLNFNDVKAYPVLDYSGISKVDIAALGTAIAQLTTSGFLSPTDDDQQWVRASMGLPARTQEQIEEANQDDPSVQELEQGDQDIEETPESDTTATDPTDVEDATTTAAQNKKDKTGKGDTKPAPKPAAKPAPKKPAPKPAAAHEHKKPVRRFSDANGFTSWRPQTFAEGKVNWNLIQTDLDKMQSDFTTDANALLNDSKDSFMAKLHQALKDNDYKTIATLELGFLIAYKSLIKKAMQDAYVHGKTDVAHEIGIDTPANTADTLKNIDLIAQTVAQKTAAALEAQVKLGVSTALKSDVPALQVSGQLDADLEQAIAKTVDDAASTLISQAMNMGRNDVFDRNSDEIYALQRSELLDSKTCNFCLSMDSRVVEKGDEWTDTDIFHSNCRGIWVAILKDEVNPPPIDGVPSNVGDYYGGNVNSLVQPKVPITKPGSLAEQFVKDQAAKAAKK